MEEIHKNKGDFFSSLLPLCSRTLFSFVSCFTILEYVILVACYVILLRPWKGSHLIELFVWNSCQDSLLREMRFHAKYCEPRTHNYHIKIATDGWLKPPCKDAWHCLTGPVLLAGGTQLLHAELGKNSSFCWSELLSNLGCQEPVEGWSSCCRLSRKFWVLGPIH